MDEVPHVLWWSVGLTGLAGLAYDALTTVCSAPEYQAADRFRFDRDRRAYLVAHGLLRHALSACAPEHAPQDWSFVRTAHGRPELDARFASSLRFNLSHCATRVSCVVSTSVDCGVDVESVARDVQTALLQEQCLAGAEQRWVRAGAPAQQTRRFMQLWTLKEAVAKAVGLGLALPFAQLEFEVEPVPRLVGAPDGVGGAWWLVQHETEDGHVEAVALGLPGERAVALSRRDWPLAPRLVQGDSRSFALRDLRRGS
jgi:4'-phosphopantetheinyl transferase